MLNPSISPVASLERLKECGLDPRQFGSCSKPVEERTPGAGRRIINVGCRYFTECSMANVPMPDKGAERPRPRYVKTRLIKPRFGGVGDGIRENYCSCAQWNGGLKNRNGKNGEIAEICGGEGDTVLLRGSVQVKREDGTVAYKPTFTKVTIPTFPDPEDAEDMLEQVYSAEVRKEADLEAVAARNAQRDVRMATRATGRNEQSQKSTQEATSDDHKKSLGSPKSP